MESVEGMMEKMKLSEAEKKGIRVVADGTRASCLAAVQAIGKVLLDWPVNMEGLAQALGVLDPRYRL